MTKQETIIFYANALAKDRLKNNGENSYLSILEYLPDTMFDQICALADSIGVLYDKKH